MQGSCRCQAWQATTRHLAVKKIPRPLIYISKSFKSEEEEMDIEEFKRRLREKMAENRKAFEGQYKNEINGLMGLSKSEIDEITPGITDLETYDQLITLVKEASRVNLTQAQLKARIEELGEVAVKIAKKVPSLASILD
jgi:hypothetical protein